MKLVHDIFIEQQQRLLMTPELRQAIGILQMSTLELNDYIQKELEENPFLEEKDTDDANLERDEDEGDQYKMEEWLEFYNDRDIGYLNRDQGTEERSYENFLTKVPSLIEHLEFQIHLLCGEQEEIKIGKYLIGSLDCNGYLTIDLEEVAARFNVSLEQVEKVLHVIQSLHPHGIGARNLGECLLIQLMHYGKDTPIAKKIVDDHLDDLAKGKLNKIAHTLSISIQQAQEICDLVRTLDPKPGSPYSNNNEIRYIIPEVFVEKIDNEYIVYTNDFNYPRLVINHLYQNIMRQPHTFSKDVRKFLEEKMGSAVWLIRSIEQRRMTLYKVARCIVDIQKEFLENGVEYLKPLKLQQVADIVDVHESTVSRATTNKYIQTPQGVFELKYFFSPGIESNHGGGKVSSKSIKHMVEELISQEDNTNPLSDELITQMLKKKGIRISRRTVAKYRHEIGIPSTTARRRY